MYTKSSKNSITGENVVGAAKIDLNGRKKSGIIRNVYCYEKKGVEKREVMDGKITIICGHYGCGKTNLSLHLAKKWAAQGEKVTLADLDIVNPYFRSSDYRQELETCGITVITPVYAGTTLDIPALPAELYSIADREGKIILDVGGDDAGATVLGGIAEKLRSENYEMLYVINCYRALSTSPEEAAELLREIEAVAKLKATAVVNNSHLKSLTTVEDVAASVPYAEETARLIGLPLKYTTIPNFLAGAAGAEEFYPVEVTVRTPWEEKK